MNIGDIHFDHCPRGDGVQICAQVVDIARLPKLSGKAFGGHMQHTFRLTVKQIRPFFEIDEGCSMTRVRPAERAFQFPLTCWVKLLSQEADALLEFPQGPPANIALMLIAEVINLLREKSQLEAAWKYSKSRRERKPYKDRHYREHQKQDPAFFHVGTQNKNE